MTEEKIITINIKIPADARRIIMAIRRALGMFKCLVESDKVCKKNGP